MTRTPPIRPSPPPTPHIRHPTSTPPSPPAAARSSKLGSTTTPASRTSPTTSASPSSSLPPGPRSRTSSTTWTRSPASPTIARRRCTPSPTTRPSRDCSASPPTPTTKRPPAAQPPPSCACQARRASEGPTPTTPRTTQDADRPTAHLRLHARQRPAHRPINQAPPRLAQRTTPRRSHPPASSQTQHHATSFARSLATAASTSSRAEAASIHPGSRAR